MTLLVLAACPTKNSFFQIMVSWNWPGNGSRKHFQCIIINNNDNGDDNIQ